MIHRLHYRYLNSYFVFYFQERHRRLFHKAKAVQKDKDEVIEITRTNTKLIGAMA
ncbi:MAG TPA: hypothetical protein VND99_01430 [Candidatus Acidoferrales bacterium]|nr:hypothetical protein [Candidatus Acidoferrales bacterium]